MYLLNGQMYTASGAPLQDALAVAHAEHLRPRCACTERAAPMYIARATGSFVVKRMPCTGHLHSLRCPHHSHESDASIGDSSQPAIQRDPVTGQVRIRAAFAMSSGETGLSLHAGRDHGLREARHRFTLCDLILYLWNEAGLTTWRPEFADKRTWAVVRHHLIRAASSTWVNGTPLTQALFVPEPFSVAKADAIRARRLDRLSRYLCSSPARDRRMLLIGEVKELSTSALQPRVVIKHLPDTIMRLPPTASGLHADQTGEPNCEPPSRLVIGATFSLNGGAALTINEFQIVSMSAEWLPARLDALWRGAP